MSSRSQVKGRSDSDDAVDKNNPIFVKPSVLWGFRVYLDSSKPVLLDLFLTISSFILLACATYLLGLEVYVSIICFGFSVRVIKFVSSYVGQTLAMKEKWEKRKNRQKFRDQFWQFVVHLLMGLWELNVAKKLNWWEDGKVWTTQREIVPDEVRLIYVVQTGIWLYSAFSHRFFEARHKDYFVMFSHHVVTIFLVIASFYSNFMCYGLLVLLLHDVSDVPLDLLKLTNYLGLDSSSGLFIVEFNFVLVTISWIYFRLYTFPMVILRQVYYPPSTLSVNHLTVVRFCQVGLTLLLLMHIYWFMLILRIAYRLLSGEKADSVSKKEYEGNSDDECEEETESTTRRRRKGNRSRKD